MQGPAGSQFCSSHRRTNSFDSPNPHQCHCIRPQTNCRLEARRLCWASCLMQAPAGSPRVLGLGRAPADALPGCAKQRHGQHGLPARATSHLHGYGKLAWQGLFCWGAPARDSTPVCPGSPGWGLSWRARKLGGTCLPSESPHLANELGLASCPSPSSSFLLSQA